MITKMGRHKAITPDNDYKEKHMQAKDWIEIAALIIIPIAAVLIGQWLQNRAEIRKDKMQIFKVLMTARVYAWTVESVNALNVLEVVFAKDRKVIAAWRDLSDKLNTNDDSEPHLNKIKNARYKLLEEMANALGYKGFISWETIQNPYIPKGLINDMQDQANGKQLYQTALGAVVSMAQNQLQNQIGTQQNGMS